MLLVTTADQTSLTSTPEARMGKVSRLKSRCWKRQHQLLCIRQTLMKRLKLSLALRSAHQSLNASIESHSNHSERALRVPTLVGLCLRTKQNPTKVGTLNTCL